MKFEQFAYWLQGFTEITRREPTPEEWEVIKAHLDTCFIKITPTFDLTKPIDLKTLNLSKHVAVC